MLVYNPAEQKMVLRFFPDLLLFSRTIWVLAFSSCLFQMIQLQNWPKINKKMAKNARYRVSEDYDTLMNQNTVKILLLDTPVIPMYYVGWVKDGLFYWKYA